VRLATRAMSPPRRCCAMLRKQKFDATCSSYATLSRRRVALPLAAMARVSTAAPQSATRGSRRIRRPSGAWSVNSCAKKAVAMGLNRRCKENRRVRKMKAAIVECLSAWPMRSAADADQGINIPRWSLLLPQKLFKISRGLI
jgi:hypothetical protein